MKKMNLIVWVFLMIGCSGIPEPEISYIDYSCCSQEELSECDYILLERVEFKEGKLSCLLGLKSALEQGIPEKKYNYFLEYLQNENQKLERYLESGAIVFYNGEPFTRNKELYQYVDNKEELLSRATYNQAAPIWTKRFTYRYDGIIPEDRADFKGPSKISVSSAGVGTFELEEKFKKLTAYIGGNESSATFKWGFGNDVQWNWKIKYFSTRGEATLYFTGHWEDPMPEFPPHDITSQKFWWNNMPVYVQLRHNKLDNYIEIYIETMGDFSAQVYKKVNKDYVLYSFLDEFSGNTRPRVSTPPECTFWIVIYRKKKLDQKITWTYLGDMEFRYPLHWQ